ncbi:MAG: hypothetical protein RR131_08755, partial [Anaerovorax sp.]
VVSYIGIPFFLVLWLGYKIKHKTKVVPLEEADFSGNYQDELKAQEAADKNKK